MIGSRLGPYEITARLGAGGMGEVYRATDTKLRREVAIKVLPTEFTEDRERLARFEREAQLLAQLQHPNIASIYGMEEAGEVRALVMELVEGPTLADRLADGPLPLEECLAIARQIARALEEAHEKGIVHRDLKPQNVKATVDGKVKVLDFGLAKAMEPAVSSSGGPITASPTLMNSPTLTAAGTQLGVILGTAAYMAPEQARGGTVDKRADIWALGVVLYEMLSGRSLFAADSVPDTLAGVLRAEIDLDALPETTPSALRRLLRRCLERKPERRMRDIGDVRWELEEVERAGGGEAAIAQPSEAAAGTLRRSAWRGLATAALGLILGLALAAGFLWVRPRQVAPPKKVKSYLLPPEGTSFSFRPQLGGPVLSPDGSRLVFAAIDGSGRTSLWVRPLDSTGARELHGTEGASYPFWSPDSRWIAFFVEGRLRKIDVGGGPPTTICDAANGRGGSWNPDGVILFATNVYSGIARVSAAGGTPAPETEVDAEGGQTSHRWPLFLPDGRHYLYWGGVPLNSAESESNGIFVRSLDGGEPTFLLPADSNALYSPPGFLLFLREDVLMAQRFDASSRTLRGEAFPIAEQVANPQNYRLGDFSVSQEGTLVYQTGEIGLSQIVRFDAQRQQGTEVGEPASVDGLRLSPDGRVLAVQVSDERSKNMDLWLIDLARDVRSRFTFEPGLELAPVWSPDGDRIAYAANPKGNLDIFVRPSSGAGEASPLIESELAKYPTSWSPDGRAIAMTALDPRGPTKTDIWIAPVDGGEPTVFLSTPFNEGNATFSPDGRWLAYQSDASGRDEIYLTPFPGPGGKWQVSQNGGQKALWRGDGEALYFRGSDGTLYEAGITEKGSVVEVGAAAPVLRLPELLTSQQSWNYQLEPGRGSFLALRQVASSAAPLTLVTHWASGLGE